MHIQQKEAAINFIKRSITTALLARRQLSSCLIARHTLAGKKNKSQVE